jgi:hypothetical protein
MQLRRIIGKGVAMIFCWDGPDFKPQTDDTSILQMYLVFNVFYFYLFWGGPEEFWGGPGPPAPPPLCYALDNWLPTKITYTVKRIRISPSPTLNIYLFEGPIDICQLYYKKKFVFEKH